MYVSVRKYINMTVSTENAATPTSTKTRNTNSSVQIQITEASRDMKLLESAVWNWASFFSVLRNPLAAIWAVS